MPLAAAAHGPTATRASAPGDDPLGLNARRTRNLWWLAGLTGLLVLVSLCVGVLSLLAGVGIGAVSISPLTVLKIVGHQVLGFPGEVTWRGTEEAIVWRVRLPRVLLGVAVGAGLAVCGAALQAMVRNMLADPYLLGINSGASSGAAAAILFGFGAGFGEHALTTSAFLGALAASLLVFLVARTSGQVTSVRLLLAGVAVGYVLYATTAFLIFASGSAEGARSVLFWLLGSLGLAQWGATLAVVLAVAALTLGVLTLWGPRLDALAIGDETARTLGISPTAFRTQLLVLVSLCVGVLVAASGSIGFVGLVVPHLARRVVGAAHSWSIPVAALMGAIFLVWADLFARVVLQPQELPIGIVTALVGAPFLLYLVRNLHATS